MDYTIALGTLKYLSKESKYVPWRTALNSLGFLDDILSDKRGNGYFQVLLHYYVILFASGIARLKITAGQRTLCGQNGLLTGQNLHSPVMLTGHADTFIPEQAVKSSFVNRPFCLFVKKK